MKKNRTAAAAARNKRLAQAQLKARLAQIRRTAADDDTEVEEEVVEDTTTEETEEKEARKYARKGRRILRACRKKAQELLEEEDIAADDAEIAEIADEVAEEAAEDVIDEVDPDAPFEEITDDIEVAVEEAVDDVVAKRKAKARKSKAARKARRTAAKARRKRAADADDLSDDLAGPDGDSSHIEQLHDGDGISVDTTVTDEEVDEQISQEPPASASEAEDKMAAAYDLIEMQMAHGVVATNIRKAALASKYAKAHTTKELKFAAEQLRSVGKAGKTASVRVKKRNSGMNVTASAATGNSDMAESCLFA